jgi:hypothetical protein
MAPALGGGRWERAEIGLAPRSRRGKNKEEKKIKW